MSLRHRASSASLRQPSTQTSNLPEKQMRRASYMKPLRKIDPGKKIILINLILISPFYLCDQKIIVAQKIFIKLIQYIIYSRT